MNEKTAFLEVADDLLVRVLDPHALEPWNIGGESPVGGDGAEKRRLGGIEVARDDLLVELVVYLAEGRGFVDEAGPLIELDELRGEHLPVQGLECAVLRLDFPAAVLLVVLLEWRPISLSEKCRTLRLADHGELPADLRRECFAQPGRDHQLSFAVLDDDVVEIRLHRRVHVGREGPRGGGPDEKRGVGLVEERERDEDRRIVDGLVALTHLGRRERRSSLRPPPDDFVTFI